jgi:ribonuclease III
VPLARIFELGPDSPHLEQALTHPSYAHEYPGAADNQRLEFLGDAILSFVTSRALYERFPSADEGELTRRRAQIVSTEALADFARCHGIGELLRFGKGGVRGSLSDSDNVLADAVEALLAAAYLDAGLATAERIGARILEHALSGPRQGAALDPKSELQNSVQARGARAPTYEVLGQEGPAHETMFEVVVRVEGQEIGRGTGRSKKAAERNAALAALAGEGWGGSKQPEAGPSEPKPLESDPPRAEEIHS